MSTRSLRPMLPLDQPLLPGETHFVHEVKWDGYRALAHLERGEAALISRNGRSLNSRFPALVRCLEERNLRAVLDGEVAALNREGQVDFSLLRTSHGQLVYIVFDLLYLQGENLCTQPWYKRRERLEELITSAGAILISPLLAGSAADSLALARDNRLEGIVSKDPSSPYLPGQRSPFWRKQRITRSLDLVLVGLRLAANKVRSMAVALYIDPQQLYYLGNVGSGLGGRELDFLQQSMGLLRIDACPVINPPPASKGDWAWLRPHVVVEVEYLELTAHKRLRHPVFRRFRFDKNPQECIMKENT